MYLMNKVLLQVIRTYAFQAEDPNDKRDGMMCVELRSPDKRYTLITDAESFATLKPAPENTAGFKGAC